MDIIHDLSNLEIETTHSSSQEVKEVKRNWVELPADVASLIFLKLGTIDILCSAQWVCSSWWKLSKQPHLFQCIHVDEIFSLFGCSISLNSNLKLAREMAREAIDRSCGLLVDFFVRGIADDELLHYMAEKSSSLKCFRLVNGYSVTDGGIIEIAKNLPQLEELEIGHPACFSNEVFETFGRFCPRIKSCRLIGPCDRVAGLPLIIAETMTELRHLSYIGNRVTDDDLRAILEGCPHLESLDLRHCFGLEFAGDLEKRCGNIKVLLPNDPTFHDEFLTLIYNDPDYFEPETNYANC